MAKPAKIINKASASPFETPSQRELRLLALATQENEAAMTRELLESLAAKPLVAKDANFLMRGVTETWSLPRMFLVRMERSRHKWHLWRKPTRKPSGTEN